MDTLLQDLRYSFRSLASRPAVFAVAAFSLALGISATTTVFAAIDAYLIRPLPYPGSKQIAQIWTTNPTRGWNRASSSVPDFLDWQRESKSIELAAFTGSSFNLLAGDRPERAGGARVTPNFFRLMGVRPTVGRWFLDEEGERGRANAVVLSDAFWRRRFAADPSLPGKTVLLDGSAYTVVGIMPKDFQFPYWGVDLWMPLVVDGTELRGSRYLSIVGRVRPGASLATAQSELASISARLAKTYPENEGMSARLLRLDRAIYDETFRLGATISGVAVLFVLLIACANVGNILLARASMRSRELALRTALGADRRRLVRQLLTESLALGLIGGALGTVLSIWGVKAFVSIIPPQFARTDTIALDGRALLFTFGIAVASSLIFGTAPAFHATAGGVSAALREGGRSGTMGLRRNRLGATLVVAEIALALALLVSAGLLIKASVRIQLTDLGFDPHGTMAMSVTLPDSPYSDSTRVLALQTQLIDRLRAIPGVESAGAVSGLPLESGSGAAYVVEGAERPKPGREPITQYRGASPGYLSTMRIPLVRGRDFTDQDRIGAPRVLLVNESFAKRHWAASGAEAAIGKRLVFNPGTPNEIVREVVGVVKDTREFGRDEEAPATVYVPAFQRWYRTLNFVVRSDADVASLASAMRAALRSIDPALPGYDVRTLDEVVRTSETADKIMPRLLTVFGGAALLLAVIGVYGVMSYSVSQRTREVGVRMALGAQRADILRLVVGQGALLAAIGLAIGLVAAAGSTRGLGVFLLGVSAYDPAIFGGVTAALGLSALLASYIPARRALRVDPLVALRDE